MSLPLLIFLVLCIFTVAILYSSVGHGGASGYIAVLALFSVAPSALKPTALALNILVSAVATANFAHAGHFSRRLFWPFAAASIPFSFLGGYLSLPTRVYQPLVGVILVASAFRLLARKEPENVDVSPLPVPAALSFGAAIGFLSGLTGVGGGIFLSPLLMLMRWGRAKEVSAVAAPFILVNSASGLLGHLSGFRAIPPYLPTLAAAALAGGIAGSWLGSRRLPASGIVHGLSAVLVVAGLKLLFF